MFSDPCYERRSLGLINGQGAQLREARRRPSLLGPPGRRCSFSKEEKEEKEIPFALWQLERGKGGGGV